MRGVLLLAQMALAAHASTLDLTNSAVVLRECGAPRCSTYATLLEEQVYKRSQVHWPADEPTTKIVLSVESPSRADATSEGYSIQTTATGVQLTGFSERGLLYAVGRLLRLLNASHTEGYETAAENSVSVVHPLNVQSSPDHQIRGHQLGYRPKTNSYDGWTAETFEQYIVELAVFGTNLIELIPWNTDDVPYSPMFPASPQSTLARVSASVDRLGLDCGLWYPMMADNYSDPTTVAAARAEWAQVFGLMKRLDKVQIPAGDPGSKPPAELLLAAKLFAADLKAAFPNASLWIGPQEWSRSQMDDWNERIRSVDWIDGLVYGPHTSLDLTTFVRTSPAHLPIRLYPDLTHSLTTQYPVPDWDRALAITESREAINPRPEQFSWIAALHLKQTRGVGFSSYSEGCHDDVNKVVWSAVAWGGDASEAFDLNQTLVEYARAFLGWGIAPQAAQLIRSLEKAWSGPLLGNPSVNASLKLVQGIERTMTPAEAYNWRLQQLRYRAFYDAHVQLRLQRETAQEARAVALLQAGLQVKTMPPPALLAKALDLLDVSPSTLDTAVGGVDELSAGTQVEALGAELFHSISMQLSVPRFFAEYTVRGANLDTRGLPLNNQPYLRQRSAEIVEMSTAEAQWAAIDELVNWKGGSGWFYDDLGDPSNQPHLVVPLSWQQDPDYYTNPLAATAIAKDLHWTDRLSKPPAALAVAPVAWQTVVNTFYNAPLMLRYTDLPQGQPYSVGVVYSHVNVYVANVGSTPPPTTSLTANGFLVHPQMAPPATQQRLWFRIPNEALQNQTSLELVWNMPPDVAGSGTGNYVAEVLLRPLSEY